MHNWISGQLQQLNFDFSLKNIFNVLIFRVVSISTDAGLTWLQLSLSLCSAVRCVSVIFLFVKLC